jgi:flagellar protein FliJ
MAKRFRFRLATLLKVRRLREREAKRKVGAKSAEIARTDELNRRTLAEISSHQAALLADQRDGRIEPLTLTRGRVWVGHLRGVLLQGQAHHAALTLELQELQAQLRQARTQTRAIEMLRERRWAAYRKQRTTQSQAAADELAQQMHSEALQWNT